MSEKIYILADGGEPEPLTEQPFAAEATLRDLVGKHPELLAGALMRPDDPLRWIFVKPEMPIEGWAVDHLLIDHEARPTLVAVKRIGNREVRCAIVGQMLDYAAAAASVWTGDRMRRTFENDARRRGSDPAGDLAKFLRLDDETDTEDTEGAANQFWEQATANLSDCRLRLLFVADEIPVAMERVVKFLNDQTRNAIEILAVEVKQHTGKCSRVLVSRLIGQDEPLGLDTPHFIGKAHNECLCGCGKDTNNRFVPGHDAKLNATLGRVARGRMREGDCDLRYVAGRCRENPAIFDYNRRTGLFYNKYSCADIIRLTEKQADIKRQKGQN